MFGFGVLPYLTLFIYGYICFLLFCIQFDLNFSAHPALWLLSEFLAVTAPALAHRVPGKPFSKQCTTVWHLVFRTA